MRILVMALLMLSALSGCKTLQAGAGNARIDAAKPYLGPCAAAMAEEDPAITRQMCLPMLIILDGAG